VVFSVLFDKLFEKQTVDPLNPGILSPNYLGEEPTYL
jgi:hypothetical protein